MFKSLLLPLASLLVVFGCSEQVDDGALEGLSIGSSKQQVFFHLVKDSNVSSVMGVLVDPLVIQSGNVSKISRLRDQPGVVVKGPDFFLRVAFVSGDVRLIYAAEVNDDSLLSAVDGDAVDRFLERVGGLIRENMEFRVFAAMPENRWVVLGASNESDRRYLFLRDRWVFHYDSSHSMISLDFSEGVLKKIRHDYSPIELP